MGHRSRPSRGLIARVVLSCALGALPLTVLQAGPASADPGFCGQRADGPTVVPDTGLYAYRVHNQCGSAHSFEVYFPQVGRSTFCAEIEPYGDHTYTYMGNTAWWEVRSC